MAYVSWFLMKRITPDPTSKVVEGGPYRPMSRHKPLTTKVPWQFTDSHESSVENSGRWLDARLLTTFQDAFVVAKINERKVVAGEDPKDSSKASTRGCECSTWVQIGGYLLKGRQGAVGSAWALGHLAESQRQDLIGPYGDFVDKGFRTIRIEEVADHAARSCLVYSANAVP